MEPENVTFWFSATRKSDIELTITHTFKRKWKCAWKNKTVKTKVGCKSLPPFDSSDHKKASVSAINTQVLVPAIPGTNLLALNLLLTVSLFN